MKNTEQLSEDWTLDVRVTENPQISRVHAERIFRLSDRAIENIYAQRETLPFVGQRLFDPIQEVVNFTCRQTAVKDIQQTPGFPHFFMAGQELAYSTPGRAKDFSFSYSSGRWFSLQGRLPVREEVDAYYGEDSRANSFPFQAVYGGFNISVVHVSVLHTERELIIDGYWTKNSMEHFLSQCLIGNHAAVSCAYREVGGNWKAGREIPDQVNLAALDRVSLR